MSETNPRIGPFEVVRQLSRAPGAVFYEARDADGIRRLLQVVHLAAVGEGATIEERTTVEQAASAMTTEVAVDVPVHAHGADDGPDGERRLYWSLPWMDAAAPTTTGPLEARTMGKVARRLAEWMAARHRRGRTHALLSQELVRIDRHGLIKVVGIPIPVSNRWLAHGLVPPPWAPEELDTEEPTPRGDLWRLGVVIQDIAARSADAGRGHLTEAEDDGLPPALRQLVDELTDDDPERRPASTEAVVRRLVDASRDLDVTPRPQSRIPVPTPASVGADDDDGQRVPTQPNHLAPPSEADDPFRVPTRRDSVASRSSSDPMNSSASIFGAQDATAVAADAASIVERRSSDAMSRLFDTAPTAQVHARGPAEEAAVDEVVGASPRAASHVGRVAVLTEEGPRSGSASAHDPFGSLERSEGPAENGVSDARRVAPSETSADLTALPVSSPDLPPELDDGAIASATGGEDGILVEGISEAEVAAALDPIAVLNGDAVVREAPSDPNFSSMSGDLEPVADGAMLDLPLSDGEDRRDETPTPVDAVAGGELRPAVSRAIGSASESPTLAGRSMLGPVPVPAGELTDDSDRGVEDLPELSEADVEVLDDGDEALEADSAQVVVAESSPLVTPVQPERGPVPYLSASATVDRSAVPRAQGGEAALPADVDKRSSPSPSVVASPAPVPISRPVVKRAEDAVTTKVTRAKSHTKKSPLSVPLPAPAQVGRSVQTKLLTGLSKGQRRAAAGVAVAGAGLLSLYALSSEREPIPVEARIARVTTDRQLTLASVPAGAEVIAERDGRVLGRTPIDIMVPSRSRLAVLVDAPGRVPMRVVLPERGALQVTLPNHPPEFCEVVVTGESEAILKAHRGPQVIPGTVAVPGAAVFRRQGAGRRVGARLVRCPPEGDRQPVAVELEPAVVRHVGVFAPIGVAVRFDGEPLERLPAQIQTERAFVQLELEGTDGARSAYWVGLEDNTEIRLPAPVAPVAPAVTSADAPSTAKAAAPKSRIRRAGRGSKKSYRRGKRALTAGKPKTAARHFRRCVKLDKSYAECHRGLGLAYLRLKQSGRAERHFKEYLRLRPDARDATEIRRHVVSSSAGQ